MATAFELLEAFVTISQRGAEDVEAALRRIQTVAKQVTERPLTVTINAAATASAATAGVAAGMAAAAAAAEEVSQSVNDVASALIVRAIPAVSSFRNGLVPVSTQFGNIQQSVLQLANASTALVPLSTTIQTISVSSNTASTALAGMVISAQRLTVLQRIGQSLAQWGSYLRNAVTQSTILGGNFGAILRTLTQVGALTVAIRTAISAFNEAASQRQSFVTFNAILQDGDRVKRLLTDIQQLSRETPFPVQQIRESVQMLLAMGTATSDVLDEFRMLANIAAGVGRPIEQISRVYTQVRSKQRLYAEELQQLGDAGVPILQELAAQFGTTTGQIRKMAEEGKLEFPALQTAFERMTAAGGKFNDIISKTAFLGQSGFQKMKESVVQLVAEFSRLGQIPIDDEMRGFVTLIDAAAAGWRELNDAIQDSVEALGSAAFDQPGFRLQTIFGAIGEAVRFRQEMERLSSSFARPLAGRDLAAEAEAARRPWEALRGSIEGTVESLATIPQLQFAQVLGAEGLKQFEAQFGSVEEIAKRVSDEIAKIMDPDFQAAQELREALLTPMEEFEAKLIEVNRLFTRGFINEDFFARAIKAAVDEADKLLERQDQIRRSVLRTGFQRGTREAFVFRMESDLTQRQQLQKTQEQLRVQQIGNEYLRTIRDDIKELKDKSTTGTTEPTQESDLF